MLFMTQNFVEKFCFSFDFISLYSSKREKSINSLSHWKNRSLSWFVFNLSFDCLCLFLHSNIWFLRKAEHRWSWKSFVSFRLVSFVTTFLIMLRVTLNFIRVILSGNKISSAKPIDSKYLAFLVEMMFLKPSKNSTWEMFPFFKSIIMLLIRFLSFLFLLTFILSPMFIASSWPIDSCSIRVSL